VDISTSATRWRFAARTVRRYNIQVEKSTFNTPDPAAHHRHDAEQSLAPVRCSNAHRARGPRAAPPISVPGIPSFTGCATCRATPSTAAGTGAPGRREGQHPAGAARPGLRRPDRPLSPGHPRARPGAGHHPGNRPTIWVGLLRSQKRVELYGIVYDGVSTLPPGMKPAEERGLRRIG